MVFVRKELKLERIKILLEIDKLKDLCNCVSPNHLNCKICKEVKALGDILIDLSNHQERKEIVIPKEKTGRKKLYNTVESSGLTVSKYHELKEHKLRDCDICEIFNLSLRDINEFKKINNIPQKRAPRFFTVEEKNRMRRIVLKEKAKYQKEVS